MFALCNLTVVTPPPSIGERQAERPQDAESQVGICPHFHEAIELIGRRWAGVILWSLIDRPAYFSELRAAIPEMSDRLLSRRLRELEAEGLVARVVHTETPPRVSYSLTEAGRGLEPAMRELRVWAQSRNGS